MAVGHNRCSAVWRSSGSAWVAVQQRAPFRSHSALANVQNEPNSEELL